MANLYLLSGKFTSRDFLKKILIYIKTIHSEYLLSIIISVYQLIYYLMQYSIYTSIIWFIGTCNKKFFMILNDLNKI